MQTKVISFNPNELSEDLKKFIKINHFVDDEGINHVFLVLENFHDNFFKYFLEGFEYPFDKIFVNSIVSFKNPDNTFTGSGYRKIGSGINLVLDNHFQYTGFDEYSLNEDSFTIQNIENIELSLSCYSVEESKIEFYREFYKTEGKWSRVKNLFSTGVEYEDEILELNFTDRNDTYSSKCLKIISRNGGEYFLDIYELISGNHLYPSERQEIRCQCVLTIEYRDRRFEFVSIIDGNGRGIIRDTEKTRRLIGLIKVLFESNAVESKSSNIYSKVSLGFNRSCEGFKELLTTWTLKD